MARALLVLAALAALPAMAQGQSLIPNGDCELDSDSDGLADVWHFSGDEGVTVSLQLDEGYKSRHSQRIMCTAFERISPSSHVLVFADTPPLTAGELYELIFAAKGERIAAGAVEVSILEAGPVWRPLGLIEAFGPRRRWRTYNFVFRAIQATGAPVRLQFWFASTGTLWLDNVCLVRLGTPSPRFTEVVPTVGGKNLVPNSSFELGKVGWGSFVRSPGWGGNLNRLFGDTDTATAAMHCRSLRIGLRSDNLPVHFTDYYPSPNMMLRQPELAPLAANRGWISVQAAQPYTLSAYLKADPPGLPALFAVQEVEEQHTAAVAVNAQWRRYSFTCRPKSSQVFVCIGPNLAGSGFTAGVLWIDAVQLESGESATDYEPRAVVELGLQKVRMGPLFWLGTPAQVEIAAFNAGADRRRVIARCSISDFRDTRTQTTRTLTVNPGQTATERIALDSSKRGFYRIALEAKGAAVVTNRPLRTAVVEPYADGDSLFGMNHAYPWPELLDICRHIGVCWFRDWTLKWQAVEPERGRFDFTEADYQIDRVLKRGLSVLGLLPFPSCNWSSTAPDNVSSTAGDGSARMVYMPKDLKEYGNYVRTTVEHYRNRIHLWEITNEPFYCGGVLAKELGYTPADYVKLLQVAYKTIKAVDPNSTVLGGIAGGPDQYTREFIEAGGLDYIDALTLHSYPCMRPPEAFIAAHGELNRRMEAQRQPHPIAFTEGAYYADDDHPYVPFERRYPTPATSEWEASVLQVRFSMILLAFNARRIIYHCGTAGSINNESLHSLFFEYDAEPRKMLVTQSAMARLFGPDTRPLGRLRTDPGIYAWAFTSRGRTVLAAWSIGEETWLGPLPAGARFLDVLGNRIAAARVELSDEPVFVILPGRTAIAKLQAMVAQKPRTK